MKVSLTEDRHVRFVVFTHSLRADSNPGNAHVLRDVLTELRERGHAVEAWEPADSWSAQNLVADAGASAFEAYARAYPGLNARTYELATLDLSQALDGADVVLVHEWNAPELVRRVGEHRARQGGFRLFFHGTHHRAVTVPEEMARFDLPTTTVDALLAIGAGLDGEPLVRGPGMPITLGHPVMEWTTRVRADIPTAPWNRPPR